jgi:hypothetical protein
VLVALKITVAAALVAIAWLVYALDRAVAAIEDEQDAQHDHPAH